MMNSQHKRKKLKRHHQAAATTTTGMPVTALYASSSNPNPHVSYKELSLSANSPNTTSSSSNSVAKPPKSTELKFIYNSYTQSRGTPKMLELNCSHCNSYIMTYQKDGPGHLLRCYLDRIHAPSDLKNRQFEKFEPKHSPNLECESCHTVIGVPTIYEPEQRPAYHMLKHQSYSNKIR